MDLANLDKMKVVDLRSELQARGLDTKGVKAVLIERLRAHLEGASEIVGSAGVVPSSPGTPSRRSRRTRSMTRSPSPSPVKKTSEPSLETLEEENNSDESNIVKPSTPERSEESVSQDNTSKAETIEHEIISRDEENNERFEEFQEDEQNSKEEVEEEDDDFEDDTDITEMEKENDQVKNMEKFETIQEKNKSSEEESNNYNEMKEVEHEKDISECSDNKLLKKHSPSHSAERAKHHSPSRSDSLSKSRSRSSHSKSKSYSRSRTRSCSQSRSPKRRSDANSLSSPSKVGEDTSTPEDEPTIEENQFGLSWFDSDLHLRIDPVTFTSAKPMTHDIYALVWSGARTNYGVREGKVCFEVRLSEETNLNRDHTFRDEPYTKGFRVGFSMPSSDLLLGESENSFAYCESGRKATNGEFVEFGKPFELDDVIGCYLDLESSPCTIKYTLNGEDLGVAFEFDKNILGENQALFPHVLTKGYEYQINLADNDNLLVNVERKVRRRRKVKKIEEKKDEEKEKDKEDMKKEKTEDEDEKKEEEEKNDENNKEHETEDSKKDEQQQDNKKEEEHTENKENGANELKQNDIVMSEEHQEEKEDKDERMVREDKTEQETTDKEQNKMREKKSSKNQEECGGPSPSKRQKIESSEENEYEEINPVPREHMCLLDGYELIALIPEENYISGPQRPKSRKDCEVILMVGLPGAGKTNWVLNHIKENPDKRYHVIGADALIAKMTIDGAPRKSVHKGRFDRVCELCFNVLTSLEDIAVKRRRNFILDQTNVYASAQRRKMKGFGDFKRIAVVCIPNDEELKRRLADKKEKGHAYSMKESTLNTLQASFNLPSLEFGWFDDIIFTDLSGSEAKEEVKKYNEKGKKALDEHHSKRDKGKRRDSYRNDNRRRHDDRRRYDHRNDSRWNDRRVGVGGGGGGAGGGGGGGGGGYYHSGIGGNRWGSGGGGGGGGYRNNPSNYRDDRGYGGGGNGGRSYDHRQQRYNSGPQNWSYNDRNRYDDRNNRYMSGSGGSGSRYDSYGGGGGVSRDYRSGGGGGGGGFDNRNYRDRNRGGNGGGNNNRRDNHRPAGSSNQRDFRPGHRDTREDSRGGSNAFPATATSSKYKSSSVVVGGNNGYDKYNKNRLQTNNWSQYQHQSAPAGQQQQHQPYWNYNMQGYGNQQQWQSMNPQQQQQWMTWWQQQGGAQGTQQSAAGGSSASASDQNQYWSQYPYSTKTDATKK